jgi:predicted secreted protein
MTGIDNPNDGSAIDIPENGTSFIMFPETPSTGYSWQARALSGINIRSSFIPDSSSGQAGTGGMRRFTLEPKETGTHKITFELRRPRSEAAIDQRTIQITVIAN